MIIRSILGLSLAVMLISLCASCRHDYFTAESGGEIVLSIPAVENVEVRSTPTSSECYIYNAAVLFVDNGTVTAAEYVTSISGNGTQSPRLGLVSINPTTATGDIVVVCNFDTSVNANTVSQLAGSSLSNAQAVIQGKAAYTSGDTSTTTGELDTPLLMYGTGTSSGTIDMRFQMAKVSVEVASGSKAEEQGLDIVNFFSYASAPNTIWGESSSSNRQTSDWSHQISSENADDWIYLYESDKPGTYPYQAFNSIVLLVNNPDTELGTSGGKGYICLTYDEMNANGTEVSTANPFLRGYHYNFKISNVHTRGYSTIEEALANPGNVEYEVEVTDDWSKIYQWNGQYVVAAAVDTVYMLYPIENATDLVQIGTYLPSENSGENITTRRVSLVRVDSGNEFETVPVSEVRLIDADGNYANDNSITLPETINSDGYMLQYITYITDEDIKEGVYLEGMYLRIEYGNIEEFIILASVNYDVNVGDIPVAGGTIEVSVTKTVWFPGKDPEVEDYSDYTITVDDDWADVDDDGNLTIDGNGVQFKDKVSGTVDLSYYNGFDTATQSTANCYIVNASGSYKFPLVYGNAIKNGATNSAAYTRQGTANGINQFVDHSGTVISSPYIYNSYTPANAIIVWQDQQDMITEVSLTDNNTYMQFTVTDNLLKGGNAVLAVRNSSNTILWSWHIWVTTYDPWADAVEGSVETGTKEITNYDNVTYHLMYCYLGSCSAANIPARSTTVQITIDDFPDAENTVTITQEGTSSVGDNCYYQSGRKDPFPGIQGGMSGDFKTTYGTYAWSNLNSKTSSSINSLANQIQYPYYLNSDDTVASTVRGYNQWNAARTDYTITNNYRDNLPVVKTVYDPSPVDFCIPPNGVYSAFFTQMLTGVAGTLNGTVASDNESIEITLPNNGGTYTLTIVPYIDGSTGVIYTEYPYSIYTATPLQKTMPNETRYNYGSLIGNSGTNDLRSAILLSGLSVYNARAIISVREPSSRSTDGNWLYD